MITFTTGDIFKCPASALVNPVNCVGVMGAGLALAFKRWFPDNFQSYACACKAGQIRTGRIFVTKVHKLDFPDWMFAPVYNDLPPASAYHRWIINFPTKQHWRDSSKLEWIVDGLHDLRRFLIENEVESVAIPALGAGLGGLDWPDVRDEIKRILSDLETTVYVYEPCPKD